jgi:hypothetical protein
MELEELLYFGHLEVVEADGPHQPIKLLFKLQVLPGDDQAIKGARLHIGQSVTHPDLLLYPVPIP